MRMPRGEMGGAASFDPGTVWPSRRISASLAVGRCFGSLARQWPTSSRRAWSVIPDRSGSMFMIRLKIAGRLSVPNGGCPVAANTIVQPQANMSAAESAASPASCSGVM